MDSSSVGDKVKRPVGRFLLNVKTISKLRSIQKEHS
jgi:hypothetical protein